MIENGRCPCGCEGVVKSRDYGVKFSENFEYSKDRLFSKEDLDKAIMKNVSFDTPLPAGYYLVTPIICPSGGAGWVGFTIQTNTLMNDGYVTESNTLYIKDVIKNKKCLLL